MNKNQEEPRLGKAFCRNLRHLMRLHPDVTQLQLAAACGLDQGYISRLVNEKSCNPTVQTMQDIADFYQVTVASMLEEHSRAENWHRTFEDPAFYKLAWLARNQPARADFIQQVIELSWKERGSR